MHFRPSWDPSQGANVHPILVAITQTSIIGSRKRRLSVREAARLQGLPDWFDSVIKQRPSLTGNSATGCLWVQWHVLRSHGKARDEEILKVVAPHLVRAVFKAGPSPDEALLVFTRG